MLKATSNTLNNVINLIFIAFIALGLVNKAYANEMSIEAEHMLTDKAKGLSTYTGHVIVKDEDITLWADTINVYFDSNNQVEKMDARGQQARFESTQNDQLTNGKATQILYFPQTEQAELIGQASLVQEESTLTGAHIKADLKTEKVEALSNTTQQRIKTTFQPKSK